VCVLHSVERRFVVLFLTFRQMLDGTSKGAMNVATSFPIHYAIKSFDAVKLGLTMSRQRHKESAITISLPSEVPLWSIPNCLLTPSFCGPLGALAPLITDTHSSMTAAFCHHLLTSIFRRSFSRTSSHLA